MGTGSLGTCSAVRTGFTQGAVRWALGSLQTAVHGSLGQLDDEVLWARVSLQAAMPRALA